jgi:hypothetical protein
MTMNFVAAHHNVGTCRGVAASADSTTMKRKVFGRAFTRTVMPLRARDRSAARVVRCRPSGALSDAVQRFVAGAGSTVGRFAGGPRTTPGPWLPHAKRPYFDAIFDRVGAASPARTATDEFPLFRWSHVRPNNYDRNN